MLIFDLSQKHRYNLAQLPHLKQLTLSIPKAYLRKTAPRLPACSELQVVRHYTQLSQRNFSIDTNFYPLGSCTMKYNPRGVHRAASMPDFLNHHPLHTENSHQGTFKALYHLQQLLLEITGMQGICLTPMAGSQGEFAGVAMIKAYHQKNNDSARTEILIPDAAHGTNPASAAMCGYKIVQLQTDPSGDICLDTLRQKVGPQTAGIMLTNPSTLGLFMRQIKDIAKIVHEAGGLLYYDGANLNAILGRVKPGNMGFDVMHLNLHKTFATPHGAGGPGAGPIAVSKRLLPFLPRPIILQENDKFRLSTQDDMPDSIGRLSCFMGNTGILLRAYFYILMLGKTGLLRVSDYATLNANYLFKRLQQIGFNAAYPERRATHEFILTLSEEKKTLHINAMDIAKRLLDYGIHAPTTYFPLLIPECLLIEPTETESKQTLDLFIEAMRRIYQEARTIPQELQSAPHYLPASRLDEVKAARELDVNYYRESTTS